ncbi:putative calcium channel flower-like isoform X2 [Apostichopus japonicus]|uniref:Putative calcium channel flower-like isoform X2 n=1 Tax=Stichopus japonicus TaxID=307972 RepID=A0A2G8LP32_STIJA|nr:putative calcium channel flower-like isoform X2 [Apostichopus japonicus]
MHIGSSNQKFTYNLNGVELQEVSVERDLGIYIDSSLQPSKHCLEAAKRVTMFLGLFSCFSVQGLCILSGIYLMFLGFGLIVMEAPVCCKFWEVTDKLGQWSQALSPLIKAALYLL